MPHRYGVRFETETELEGCVECPMQNGCALSRCPHGFFRNDIPEGCPMDHVYVDAHGCQHDGGIGWNPQGVNCGECTREDGPQCPAYTATGGSYGV